MKVTCESCGSKYTIKDEKVRGKRVKIRCKGCKSPIVVDGTTLDGGAAQSATAAVSESVAPEAYSQAPAASEAPVPAAATGVEPGAAVPSPESSAPHGGERWSVNLSETDSRDMTTEEIVAAWGSLVTDDAYVYKPGYADWKPILEVPELAALLSSPGEVPDAFSAPEGQSPFAAGGGARAAAAERGGDLFGNVAVAGSEDDPGFAPPPAVPMGESKPTGARNESSVLFSLDALKAGFEPAKTPAQAPAPSNNDPFGLSASASFGALGGSAFDQNAALLSAPPPEPKKPKKISLAPAAEGEQAGGFDRGKLIMLAAGVLVLVLAVGGVGYALGGGSSDKDQTAENEGGDEQAPAKAREGKSANDDSVSKSDKKAEDKAPDDSDTKQQAEAADASEKDEDKAEEKDAKADATDKGGDTKTAVASKTSADKSNEAKTDSKSSAKETKKPAPKDEGGSAPPFNKGAAISALSAAAGSAAGCKIPGGPTGRGKAVVTFAPSGRATTANVVGGGFGGTSVGGCVASRFRRARVPAFSGGPVTVSKSFSIQ